MIDDTKILQEEAEWRRARDSERATAQTARTIGLLAMVDVGWQIWSRTEGEPDSFIMDADSEPVGGIVLEVGDKVTYFDPDTGEVARVRSFKTVDPYNRRYHSLTEKQVDPGRVMPPDAALSLRMIGYLATALVEDMRPRRRQVDEGKVLAAVAVMQQLAAGLHRRMGA